MDRPLSIAVEYIRWAQRNGVSTADIAQEFGGKREFVSWDDAVWIVAAAWDRLAIRNVARAA